MDIFKASGVNMSSPLDLDDANGSKFQISPPQLTTLPMNEFSLMSANFLSHSPQAMENGIESINEPFGRLNSTKDAHQLSSPNFASHLPVSAPYQQEAFSMIQSLEELNDVSTSLGNFTGYPLSTASHFTSISYPASPPDQASRSKQASCSDDEETHGVIGSADSDNKPRSRLTREQTAILKRVYSCTYFPDKATKEQLSRELAIPVRTIQIWFQNQRQYHRLKMKKKATQQHQSNMYRGGYQPTLQGQVPRRHSAPPRYQPMVSPSSMMPAAMNGGFMPMVSPIPHGMMVPHLMGTLPTVDETISFQADSQSQLSAGSNPYLAIPPAAELYSSASLTADGQMYMPSAQPDYSPADGIPDVFGTALSVIPSSATSAEMTVEADYLFKSNNSMVV